MEHSERKREPNQTNIPDDVLDRMEGAYHADFSNVRVRESSEATAIGAVAFARGADVHFAPGQYDPHSAGGQDVLGHELAHVIQQHEGRASGVQGKGLPIVVDEAHETEADALGARAARGEPAASREGPLRTPGRSGVGVIQAMFVLDGSTYQVLNAIPGVALAPGDVVTAQANTVAGFKVLRKSDLLSIDVPHAHATGANFQKLVVPPGHADYIPRFGKPGIPYYSVGPKVSDDAAKTVEVVVNKKKMKTFQSAFQPVDIDKVNFNDLSFEEDILPKQKGIDRAAITLIQEALRAKLAFVRDGMDKITGESRKVLYVADVWCGEFVAYVDADKDHLFNQANMMLMLKELETQANTNEFSRVQIATMLRTSGAGKLLQANPADPKSWFITKGTVDSQYSNTVNLGFAGKALNQRDKNDDDVFTTMGKSVLHDNLTGNFDGKQMVGHDGRLVGKAIKDNLLEAENEELVRRNKKLKRMHAYTQDQSTKVRVDQRLEKKRRGVNDAEADEHKLAAETRERKLHLEVDVLAKVADNVDSENEDELSDMEELVHGNLDATFDGFRTGEEVDIPVLQETIREKDAAFASLKEQFDDVENELIVAEQAEETARDMAEQEKENAAIYQQRMRAAERQVGDLENEKQALEDEVTRLKAEIQRLKQQPQQ